MENQDSFISVYQMEIENRIKNMVWTVCGDYTLAVRPDLELYRKSPDIALYDAVKQGAFVQYFEKEQLSMYLIKKIFLGADERKLLNLSQLCIDAAICDRITADRPGTASLRKRAYAAILRQDEEQMSMYRVGRAKIAWMKHALGTYRISNMENQRRLELLLDICSVTDTEELIARIDELYNSWVDPSFLHKHGTLRDVLGVTLEEMKEFDWKDFLSEEAIEETLEDILEKMSREMVTTHSPEKKEEKDGASSGRKKVTLVTEEDFAKVYSYIETNFGRTYLTPLEEKKNNYRYCRGIHADCGLFYTKGILDNPVRHNYQYAYALRQKRKNENYLKAHYSLVRQNIQALTQLLKKAISLHNEVTYVPADSGMLVPSRLWRAGRVQDPRLFLKEKKEQQQDLVVEILIDASGSQQERQEQVAMQAYILMEALSNVHIPHRVNSFCTFWDYTVLQQFRDYDDPQSVNGRMMNFATSSNNRDGLAIRAVSGDLLNRDEDKKILLILSDGRPYDVIANRPNARNPMPYRGDYAVADTAQEIRGLRNNGVSVLGIFAGEEQDLEAEKRIFGKDFAYIRRLDNFYKVTGRYLEKQWEQ